VLLLLLLLLRFNLFSYPGVCLSACNVWHFGDTLYIVLAIIVILTFPICYFVIIYAILKTRLHKDTGAVWVKSKFESLCRPMDDDEKASMSMCNCLGDWMTLVCLRIQNLVNAAVFYGAWVPGPAPGGDDFTLMYSPLFSNFRPNSAYFSLLEMGKVLVTCFLIGLFGSTNNTGITAQAILIFIVYFLYWICLLVKFPYR
jgi:hypothetical protein